VWLACTRQLAYFLERVCLGRRAAPEAAGVPVFVNALGAAGASSGARDAETRPVVVRLSPEEAFYMAHRMDCLTVHGVERGVPPGEAVPDPGRADGETRGAREGEDRTWLMRLSRTELWRALARLGAENPEEENPGSFGGGFVARYAAHAHFRNQGWLPRSGLQYGADFVLYRNHPSLVHSDFCVVLAPEAGAGGDLNARDAGETAPTPPRARLGLRKWTEVQAASRLCVQVNKGLISASVTFSEPADASTPACLRSIAVEETEVRRFNPERNKAA
jgi:tRNA-splicing endonuclease subunit Sen2